MDSSDEFSATSKTPLLVRAIQTIAMLDMPYALISQTVHENRHMLCRQHSKVSVCGPSCQVLTIIVRSFGYAAASDQHDTDSKQYR